MRPEDIEQPPCQCEACVLAGISHKPVRRDPRTGQLLHGKALRKWWEAHDAFWAQFGTTKPKGMR